MEITLAQYKDTRRAYLLYFSGKSILCTMLKYALYAKAHIQTCV